MNSLMIVVLLRLFASARHVRDASNRSLDDVFHDYGILYIVLICDDCGAAVLPGRHMGAPEGVPCDQSRAQCGSREEPAVGGVEGDAPDAHHRRQALGHRPPALV